MEKDQIIILEDRGLISIAGEDAKEFMQNIITNDINKVSASNSIFSGLFTPQGKYLYEFFIIRGENGYFLDCDSEFSLELINHFSRHKLRSRIEIKNLYGLTFDAKEKIAIEKILGGTNDLCSP